MSIVRSSMLIALLVLGSDTLLAQADTSRSVTALTAQDTLPRRRIPVDYSEWYGTRATIHRRLSYTMLPLFAASYISGDKLFKEGSTASGLTKNVHRASATAVSALFAVNTVTGGINLWQSRHDPIDRKRKIVHTLLFTAASAGFTYAGVVLADQAETSLSKRQAHRNVNLVSMGLSSASVLVMMVGHDR
ncbi:MAG: hypothetical protein ABI852_22355 [Gemmatimonadaceae bacterium]